MEYLLFFHNGIAAFSSPCLLPMLPIYAAYFAAGGKRSLRQSLSCGVGFAAGLTAVFLAMGALAGTLGALLSAWQRPIALFCGIAIIGFGLNTLGLFRWNLSWGGSRMLDARSLSVFSAFFFGMLFALAWAPCAGTFLSPALMSAHRQGYITAGIGSVLACSLGLGIPFILTALLTDALKAAFARLRRRRKYADLLSGGILILGGILIAAGAMGQLLRRQMDAGDVIAVFRPGLFRLS